MKKSKYSIEVKALKVLSKINVWNLRNQFNNSRQFRLRKLFLWSW